MTFFQAITTGFRKYADFRGRASRSEFWWWALFTVLVSAILAAIPVPAFAYADGTITFTPEITPVWNLVVLLPSLAVLVRRLRDGGFGWGHAFWVLLPIAGLIVVAVLAAQPSRQYSGSPAPAQPVLAPE
jgi:uncharacterized membrane protein YhaH (DUF805 family)